MKYYCPQCSHEVHPLAERCKHCPAHFGAGSWRPITQAALDRKSDRKPLIIFAIVAVLVGGPIAGMLLSDAFGKPNLGFVFGWSLLFTAPVALALSLIVGLQSTKARGP
jgi:hypothetical protein